MNKLSDYEINLRIDDNIYTDVQYCAFVRTPLTKLASFCIIKIVLPELQILKLQSQISNNSFPNMLLNIYSVPTSNTTTKEDVPELIFTKLLMCISISPNTIKLEQVTNVCTLILIHPIIYYLFKNNTYNRLLENVTGHEALDNFHNFLTNVFGDIFNFNFIGDSAYLNSYKYEHILIRMPKDLLVPIYLITNYHINNCICFYFYDAFNISSTNKKEIICNYINLYNYANSFKRIDIYKYPDTAITYNKHSIVTIADLESNIVNQDSKQYIFTHSDIKYKMEANKTDKIIKKVPGATSSKNIIQDRHIQVVGSGLEVLTNYNKTSAITKIYCSDSLDNGKLRYKNTIDFYQNKIKNFVTYEFTNCIPDIFQFGNLYNLEPELPNQYNFTPINIINCFIRKNLKEPYLDHLAKILFLEFRKIIK